MKARLEPTPPKDVRPLTICIAALGGQGGGVLADWIVDLAEHAGWLAQATSVPGVAQRTGATIYYLELFPGDAAKAAGLIPVLALTPTPGDVDVLIAAELMEAGRAVGRGFATPDRTLTIASTHRVYAIAEKSAQGDGRAASGAVLDAVAAQSRRAVMADLDAAAASAGAPIGAALFGALAEAGALPFAAEAYRDTIRRGALAVESNLRGFEAGMAAVVGAPAAAPSSKAVTGPDLSEIAALARARLIDYQGRAYADLYARRLAVIEAAERGADGDGAELPVTLALARRLAVAMSYEDIVRVADLKTRRARFARVRAETRADVDQIVNVVEFMHPRVEEVCDSLPTKLGRAVIASGPLRRALAAVLGHGRKIETSTITGFVLLRLIAAGRPLRPGSLRFARENARLEDWLERVAAALPRDRSFALALVDLQRLVRGYSDTHARGLAKYARILAALDAAGAKPDAGARLNMLIEAAMADEDDAPLDAALSLD